VEEPLDGGMDADQQLSQPGTPTPSADLESRLRQLEQENAKLREERRAERAARLGVELGLTPTEVELLKMLPADQMRAKAEALAQERAQLKAADEPASEPAAPPPAASPDVAAFDREPAGGQPPLDRSLSWQDELNERLAKATSLAEVQAIQEEFRARQLAAQ
jgi:hypothetical protein